MNTAAFGKDSQKYSAIWYCTLLYFWHNWFVIYSQNKMVCDSFLITGIMTTFRDRIVVINSCDFPRCSTKDEDWD